jgi:hypothetical protein
MSLHGYRISPHSFGFSLYCNNPNKSPTFQNDPPKLGMSIYDSWISFYNTGIRIYVSRISLPSLFRKRIIMEQGQNHERSSRKVSTDIEIGGPIQAIYDAPIITPLVS